MIDEARLDELRWSWENEPADDDNRRFSTFFDKQPGATRSPAVAVFEVCGSMVTRLFCGQIWSQNERVTNGKKFFKFPAL